MSQSDQVRVVACPNPFRQASVDMLAAQGSTLQQIIEQAQPDPILRAHAHVFVDDLEIAPELWAETVPETGQLVILRVVPHGGGDGDKNPLATILSIVVIAAAALVSNGAAAGLLGSAFAEGTVGAAALGAGVGIVGSLAVAAIAPPPSQRLGQLSGSSAKESPTLSISGARNQLPPYRPIPRLYGKHKITPFFGAPPYTELVGQDQYLRLLFVLGYGPLDIDESTFKIGENLLSGYQGVQYEVREGYAGETACTLYPGQVTETGVGTLLSNAAGWVQQTTLPDTDEASIDVIFARGLVEFDNQGNKQPLTVDFDAEYQAVGDTVWTSVSPIVDVPQQTVTPPAPPVPYYDYIEDQGG